MLVIFMKEKEFEGTHSHKIISRLKERILNPSDFVRKTEITLTFKPTNLTLQKQVHMLCLYVCLFVKVINSMCF
jgi:hypothetical protein